MTSTGNAQQLHGDNAFDFVHGRWHVVNRKRRDALDPDCTEWDEFASTSEHRALPGKAGNLETYETHDLPGVGEFHGLALRLYDPDADEWRIWWSSSRTRGHLDVPMVGRFEGTRGVFFSDDVVTGVKVGVRFVWEHLPDDSARWEQAFSRDGGQTWDTNWVMTCTRAS
jgi:hypothetical protein